ncbi:hypothetical protein EYM_05970 [Ignicoccus islandicus DSM 13165]|uniref:Uncharacterized protein n=1 Tax=Ignicoccus islandicus DSM 13165 TaxID=940295 RepID=A0A0U3E3Z1_9CREN|nr:hypothetical protein [Ignicoccus islandicus]ALU12635.1 hypothetical protein EYM_05970 [Ignicoccus islandicus DSM 13165]
MSWKPIFATKKLVRDYEPLRYYLELVRDTEWYDKAFLSGADFKLLSAVVQNNKDKANLLAVWKMLTEKMKSRINSKMAYRALKNSGYHVRDEEEARDLMARMLAGWLLEAGEEWNLIRMNF